MFHRHGLRLALALVLLSSCSRAPQQRANPAFEPKIDDPTFTAGDASEPTICLDEGHHNFHTLEGRYAPFGKVLQADGYRVEAFTGGFTSDALARCDVLVIANALNERNISDWSLPTPSAFTTEEVAIVHAWVEGGGGLWLIADHMPFPGAAQELAGAFGFELANGFAMRENHEGPDLFTRGDGSLADHPLTAGIEQVASFTGEAFRAPPQAQPILVLDDAFLSLEPAVAWQFDAQTPRREVGGWLQAATLELGKGRVAMFGEAAMFTSQVVDQGPPMGLDHPDAIGNTELLRNIARWLAGA
jgi:hypothetical protein